MCNVFLCHAYFHFLVRYDFLHHVPFHLLCYFFSYYSIIITFAILLITLAYTLSGGVFMNKIFVINSKHLVISIFSIIFLLSLCLAGNSLLDNVIETASNNRLLPIYSVETDKKVVALTFDCAWRS